MIIKRRKERVRCRCRKTRLGILGIINKTIIVVSRASKWRKVSAFPPVNVLVLRAIYRLGILFQIWYH